MQPGRGAWGHGAGAVTLESSRLGGTTPDELETDAVYTLATADGGGVPVGTLPGVDAAPFAAAAAGRRGGGLTLGDVTD